MNNLLVILVFLIAMPSTMAQFSSDELIGVRQNSRHFDELLNKVKKVYQPYFSQLGVQLVTLNNWQDDTISAAAFRRPRRWFISLTGGMARHPEMTDDGYLTVACHEIGHHLAGRPKWRNRLGGFRWSSNEGQSDYYAMLKCLKLVLRGENHRLALSGQRIPQIVQNDCNARYINEERPLCYRLALAALSAVRVQEAREEKPLTAFFDTPSGKTVRSTFDNHNSPQCRLDTLYAGVLCNKPVLPHLDGETRQINCLKSEGFTKEARPVCWYKSQ